MHSRQVAKTNQKDEHWESRSSTKAAFRTSGNIHSLPHLQNSIGNQGVRQLIQAKLKVGQPGDKYEREADRAAQVVMNLPGSRKIARNSLNGKAGSERVQRPYVTFEEEIRRMPLDEEDFAEEEEFEDEGEDTLRMKSAGSSIPRVSDRMQSRIDNLRGSGQSLPGSARTFFESQFGNDFSRVRVHNDARSANIARALNARAFTVGRDIFFGAREYSPKTIEGRGLMAHELTHVLQQSGGTAPQVQRAPEKKRKKKRQRRSKERSSRSGSKERSSKSGSKGGGANAYKKISMLYNGSELIVYGDKKEVRRYSATSGRPVKITPEVAAACGANQATDTYLNDKRFVGIKDHGPIPEGRYTFKPPRIERFSSSERWRLFRAKIFGKKRINIAGKSIGTGDWGAGRVKLTPDKLKEGPCGRVNKKGKKEGRKDFFLHGGWFAGSSGCIDIGSHFGDLADFLEGYKGSIEVKVKYTEPPPSVGVLTGLGGAIGYKGFHLRHGPGVRFGAEFSSHGSRPIGSLEYNAILDWAGGALAAGVHVDLPLNDPDAFIRAGLRGELEFRILRALHGRLTGGYSREYSGGKETGGLEYGGGLSYDFGRVQLEATYNELRSAAEENKRVRQVLGGIGIRWP